MPLTKHTEEIRNKLRQEAKAHAGKSDDEVAQALGIGTEHYRKHIKEKPATSSWSTGDSGSGNWWEKSKPEPSGRSSDNWNSWSSNSGNWRYYYYNPGSGGYYRNNNARDDAWWEEFWRNYRSGSGNWGYGSSETGGKKQSSGTGSNKQSSDTGSKTSSSKPATTEEQVIDILTKWWAKTDSYIGPISAYEEDRRSSKSIKDFEKTGRTDRKNLMSQKLLEPKLHDGTGALKFLTSKTGNIADMLAVNQVLTCIVSPMHCHPDKSAVLAFFNKVTYTSTGEPAYHKSTGSIVGFARRFNKLLDTDLNKNQLQNLAATAKCAGTQGVSAIFLLDVLSAFCHGISQDALPMCKRYNTDLKDCIEEKTKKTEAAKIKVGLCKSKCVKDLGSVGEQHDKCVKECEKDLTNEKPEEQCVIEHAKGKDTCDKDWNNLPCNKISAGLFSGSDPCSGTLRSFLIDGGIALEKRVNQFCSSRPSQEDKALRQCIISAPSTVAQDQLESILNKCTSSTVKDLIDTYHGKICSEAKTTIGTVDCVKSTGNISDAMSAFCNDSNTAQALELPVGVTYTPEDFVF